MMRLIIINQKVKNNGHFSIHCVGNDELVA